MQVADYSRVIDMGDKNILKNVIKEFKPDYVVPEIEALSIEALKELEDEGFNIVPNARTVEITMNRDCLLYTSPSPRDRQKSRMPSSA